MFLKLHDGYPEPVKVRFRESEYGYFWKRRFTDPQTGEMKHFPLKEDNIASTIAMLREVFNNRIMSMRRPFERPTNFKENVAKYIEGGKRKFDDNWVIGRLETSYAGYHCTWYAYLVILCTA